MNLINTRSVKKFKKIQMVPNKGFAAVSIVNLNADIVQPNTNDMVSIVIKPSMYFDV